MSSQHKPQMKKLLIAAHLILLSYFTAALLSGRVTSDHEGCKCHHSGAENALKCHL